MSTAILKKSLGEAGAFIDESNGAPNGLYDVVAALSADGSRLNAYQATIALGVIGRMVVDVASTLGVIYTHVAVTGTTTPTVVQVRVNGDDVGDTVTTGFAEANGTSKGVNQGIAVAAGDLVEIEVTGAPTSGTGLTATLRFQPVTIEV